MVGENYVMGNFVIRISICDWSEKWKRKVARHVARMEAWKIFTGICESRRKLENLGRRWKDKNIGVQEIGWHRLDGVQPAGDAIRWLLLMKAILQLWLRDGRELCDNLISCSLIMADSTTLLPTEFHACFACLLLLFLGTEQMWFNSIIFFFAFFLLFI